MLVLAVSFVTVRRKFQPTTNTQTYYLFCCLS